MPDRLTVEPVLVINYVLKLHRQQESIIISQWRGRLGKRHVGLQFGYREQSVTQCPRHMGRRFRQTKAIRQFRSISAKTACSAMRGGCEIKRLT